MNRLLIVDDSPQDIQILLELLKDDYQVSAATNADDAIQLLADAGKPDLLLLDVNMPGTDGFEMSKKIKDSDELRDIDFIFVSGNDSTDEVIKGYELGAIDYVVKPYVPEILMSKVQGAIQNSEARKNLKSAAENANKIAMTAMSDTGDLGIVVNFLRDSFHTSNIEQLGESVINTLGNFGLEASLYMKLDRLETIAGTGAGATTMAMELMKRLECSTGGEPFVQHGRKLFVHQKYTVVLVDNMPESEEQCGRLKDYMMILLEGANAKLEYLGEQAKKADMRASSMNQVILDAEQALLEVQGLQGEHKRQSIRILDDMVQEVEDSLFAMGLTDTQEEELKAILDRAVGASQDHLDEGIKIDERVKGIIETISRFARADQQTH